MIFIPSVNKLFGPTQAIQAFEICKQNQAIVMPLYSESKGTRDGIPKKINKTEGCYNK